ncbi:hypothetical protein PBY51_014024 [Eleginops maclovinus]|uniref:3',5'-cyclic-AMP phosphodiesterase n=1 Tax=Eleginops maclovinus TaxID=56733 RepID=A0AAN7WVV5_ELEMC|nr:hypothetical protein PBY51_014024 [Eleginops maclovinus]
MEVCYQLPVLPLDRPVPKHVLSRRGAISFSSSSSLFGAPDPRQLSQRRGAISYDSSDQTALYIRMLDVRVRSQVGFEPERRSSHPYLCIDFRTLHTRLGHGTTAAGSSPERRVHRLLSFQRYLHSSRLLRGVPQQIPLHILDEDYTGQARCMLEKVGTWNFDIFLFDRLTNGNSLITLTFHLLNQYGLVELFQLDMVKLWRFLVMVQEDYHSDNPYHNAVHAADVTQAMYCFMQEPILAKSLTSCDILLGLIAAATHDLDHPGSTSLSSSRLTTILLHSIGIPQETGLFSHLPAEDSLNMERELGSLILATDISRQNDYLSRFRRHLDQDNLCLSNASHRHFLLQMALKCADICNPCRPWELSKQWSEKVTDEFFQQGDIEKKHKLEVSPVCDRGINTVGDIQIGFMSYVVEPLFAEWTRFSDTRLSQTMMGHMRLNKASWGALQQQQTSVSVEAEPSSPGTDAEDGGATGGSSSKEIPQGSRES